MTTGKTDVASRHALAPILPEQSRTRGDKVAVVFEGRTRTYAELESRSNRVAQALVAHGVTPQDRVAFFDRNCLEYLDILFGAAKLNAVVAPVNWRLSPGEAAAVVADSQARVLVIGPDFAEHEREISAQAPLVDVIVHTGESFDAWLAPHADIDCETPSEPDDVVYQFYTSGTTGLPKGVMITNANLAATAEYAHLWGFGPDEVVLVCLPLFHLGGGAWIATGLKAGAVNVLLRDGGADSIVNAITENDVTLMMVVPAIVKGIVETAEARNRRLPSLRRVVYGTAPISPDLLARAVELFGCDLVQSYGLTEASGALLALMPEDHDLSEAGRGRLAAAGKPVPDVDLRIVDSESGAEVATGETGELWFRTPGLMKGYWNRPDETANVVTPDGWLRTGDSGYVDEDGYVYLTGRVKDLIVSGGENVYPGEVERVLTDHPHVADAAVIGVPHERWGETVKAVVVPRGSLDVADLIAFARDRLAHFKCPTTVDLVDALPTTAMGKVDKKALRAPYWAGRDRQVN